MKNLITEVKLEQIPPDLWLDELSNPIYPTNYKGQPPICDEDLFRYDDSWYFSQISEYEINTKISNKSDEVLLKNCHQDAYVKQEVLLRRLQSIRNFFEMTWKPQRQQSISSLADLSEYLQTLDSSFQTGMLWYSGAGIAGDIMSMIGLIGAPFTVGISLGLTVGGVVLGAISRSANIVHALINNALTKSKCHDTLIVLEKDLILSEKLLNMLKELKRSGDLNHSIGSNAEHLMQMFMSFPKVSKTIFILRMISAMSDIDPEKEPANFRSIVDAIRSTMEGEATPTVSTALSYILGLIPGIGTMYNVYIIVNSSRSLYLNKNDPVVVEVQDEMVKLAEEIYDMSEIIDQLEKTCV